MTLLETETVGICMRRENRGTATTPNLWEAPRDQERMASVVQRHQRARLLCRRCPLLDACESYLSATEKDGKRVGGVVAARYSDIRPAWTEEWQSACAGCGKPMRPQHVSQRSKPRKTARIHVGEGLCDDCYPRLRRNK